MLIFSLLVPISNLLMLIFDLLVLIFDLLKLTFDLIVLIFAPSMLIFDLCPSAGVLRSMAWRRRGGHQVDEGGQYERQSVSAVSLSITNVSGDPIELLKIARLLVFLLAHLNHSLIELKRFK